MIWNIRNNVISIDRNTTDSESLLLTWFNFNRSMDE